MNPYSSPVRLSILGSCVSRDIFALAPPAGVELVRYVARVSLASMFAEPAPLKLPPLDNKWDSRMLELDVTKRSAHYLFEEPFDVLLVDLIDERHLLWTMGDAAITHTTAFSRSGLLEKLTNGWRRHRIGDALRMRLWTEGVQLLGQRLSGQRVILNKVLCADRYSDGEIAEGVPQAEVGVMLNATLPAMYEIFEREIPCGVIEYPPELLTLPREHKWGLAPFHYRPEAYAHASAEIQRITAGLSARTKRPADPGASIAR
jgi:hypothetical protein